MKKIIIIFVIATAMLTGGCGLTGCRSNGPVAPESESNKTSEIGDPQLPSPNVWWK